MMTIALISEVTWDRIGAGAHAISSPAKLTKKVANRNITISPKG